MTFRKVKPMFRWQVTELKFTLFLGADMVWNHEFYYHLKLLGLDWMIKDDILEYLMNSSFTRSLIDL